MKRIPLYVQVLLALVFGGVFAFMSITFGFNEFTLNFIDPFGKIFINLLKLIAVPLVLFSIISGVSSLRDLNKLGKIGFKTLGMYLATTVIAVSVGLIAVNVIKPGERVSEELRLDNRIGYELWAIEKDIPLNQDRCESCNSENAARTEEARSRLAQEDTEEGIADKLNKAQKSKQSRPLQPLVDIVPSNIIGAMYAMEMLQVIFFAVFFGIVLVMLPEEKSKPVSDFINSVNDVFVKMVDVVMRAMPFFVFCLLSGAVVTMAGEDSERLSQLFTFLFWYSVTVIVGLFFIVGILYPTLIALFVKKLSALRFIRGMRDAQLTAFSTSSSLATLPLTLHAVENNLGVSKRMSGFVLPIGATVNMDGTSLYQAVAVVALAQFHWVDLSIMQQLTIVLTATLASVGAAAIPSAGLVLLILVLESVGLNPLWFALIVPVDRILDMCRTVVNITGDACVATIVASAEGELEDRT